MIRLILLAAVAVHAHGLSEPAPLEGEVLEASWPQDPANGTFWVAFRNVSDAPLYLCLSTLDYAWSGDGVNPEGTVSSTTHSCETAKEFHLLLPGEPLRVLKVAPPPLGAVAGSTVQFMANVYYRRDGEPVHHTPRLVEATHSWSGPGEQ